MNTRTALTLAGVALAGLSGPIASPPAAAQSAVRPLEVRGFAFELEVIVAGTPDRAYDAFTRDTIRWWDHHFSKEPVRLSFDATPGGGFVEIFDAQGNGAWHATVVYVERPRMLRFTGPLGLSGNGIDLVHTLTFEAVEGGTKLRLTVKGVGEMEAGWPEAVERTWRHFLVERFQPYMAGTLGKAGSR